MFYNKSKVIVKEFKKSLMNIECNKKLLYLTNLTLLKVNISLILN